MRIKRYFLFFLSLVIVCGLLGCADKNSDASYVFLPQTELHSLKQSSGFHCNYKYKYKYDSYGNVVKRQEYTKGTFYKRQFCFDTTYTYDQDGKILKELIREEQFSIAITDGSYVFEEGFDYFYNESGQLIKKDIIYISAVVDELCGYKYEYDENGNCIKEKKYYSDGTEELNLEYFYDSNNKLTKMKTLYSSRDFNLKYVSEETDYQYDEDGKLVYKKAISKDGSRTEYKYTYDELGRLVKEESKRIKEDGKISREDVREYKNFVKIAVNT